MNSIEFLRQYFNRDDINHYGKGRMGLSIRAVARLVKVHNTTLGAGLGLYGGAGKINVKLSESIDKAGFLLLERRSWSQDGIPDVAVAVIIAHYSRYAKEIDSEVVALADYLVARSMREVLQECYGYSEVTEQSQGFTINQQQWDWLQEQITQMQSNMSQMNQVLFESSAQHPGFVNIFSKKSQALTQKLLPGSNPNKLYTANDYLALRGVKLTRQGRHAFYGQVAYVFRNLTYTRPVTVKVSNSSQANAYRECDFPLLDNALEAVLKEFGQTAN